MGHFPWISPLSPQALIRPLNSKSKKCQQKNKKTKYLKKININYLVLSVMIVRKSRAKCGRAASNSWCPRNSTGKVPIRTESGGGQNLFFPFRSFPKLLTSHRDFFKILFGVKWYIKSNFLQFFWLSLYNKALRTKKIWIFWRARPTRMFFIEIENNENVVDIRKFWGLSQASGFRLSVHCFYIRINGLFPMNIISNKIQLQARIWPTSTQSLECRYTLLVTAAQWTDCVPTIQYFHSCAPIWWSIWLTTMYWVTHMPYMQYMRS